MNESLPQTVYRVGSRSRDGLVTIDGVDYETRYQAIERRKVVRHKHPDTDWVIVSRTVSEWEVEDSAIELDLSDWTRLSEVKEYARRRNIDLGEAILNMVNSGLSHYQGTPLTERKP